MQLKFIEGTNGLANWGKFALGTFTPEEWHQRAVIDGGSLIAGRGWTSRHVWVLDLQTGEGAMFLPGGLAKHDLDKHAIWVCPMYEPMLEWLYGRLRGVEDVAAAIAALPDHVDLPDAPFAMSGYRRSGWCRVVTDKRLAELTARTVGVEPDANVEIDATEFKNIIAELCLRRAGTQ